MRSFYHDYLFIFRDNKDSVNRNQYKRSLLVFINEAQPILSEDINYLNLSSMGAKKNFVIDTNVILPDYNCLKNFQENDIYLPIVVLRNWTSSRKATNRLILMRVSLSANWT